MATTRGIRKVSENILADGRAIIITDKDKNNYKWVDIPLGSKFIDTKTGIEYVKLEGESDWVPAGIKNDGTICIAKDTKVVTEIFTIVNPNEGNGHFSCTNQNGDMRHFELTNEGYVFQLEQGSYQMGRNQLEVTIDDCLNRSASSGGIEEASSTKVILKDALVAGQEIAIRYGNVLRIGNPYPRVFISKSKPENAEVGDFWVDTDAEVSDEDDLGINEELESTISWDRITGKPNTVSGYKIIDKISYEGHTHVYSDIANPPQSLPANGGNASTVNNYTASANKANTLAIIGSDGKLPTSIMPSTFVTGMIMMWYGSSSNVPSGWAICNGSNGTPDLRDRFIVGAGNAYSLGSTGGEKTHILTTQEMPSHTHSVKTDATAKAIGSFRTWKHDPQATGVFSQTQTENCNSKNGGGDPGWRVDLNINKIGLYMELDNAGGGGEHENRPPYYALFYIMKL